MSDHRDVQHRGKGYHMEWELRADRAAVWSKRMVALRPNLFPYGTHLRRWMLGQKPWFLPVLAHDDPVFTNPYTMDVAVLTAVYIRVTNSGAEWAMDDVGPLSWVTAEVQRVRYYSEFVLYTTRLIEGLIKQLLFCTGFESKDYRRAALGELLLRDCKPCRKADKPHGVSLLGSLAHHYRLCAGYDNCLEVDLPKLNKLRNSLVAHSGIWHLEHVDAATARKNLHDASIETGELFLHMLQHIGAIEEAMIAEISGHIRPA